MPALTLSKKNKITLTDYAFARDIENRLLMASFSVFDVEVIDELLSSSLSIPLKRLKDSFGPEVMETLRKLEPTGLIKLVNDSVLIDKELRKYFEAEILKFDSQFAPGIDFIKGFLKKVPIEVLPTWYSISRTSNDIFESIIEKYLATPKLFNRHYEELKGEIPLLSVIWEQLLEAEDFSIPSEDLRRKLGLDLEEFSEILLLLEFNFICCLLFKKVNESWIEIVTFFDHWKRYLQAVARLDAVEQQHEKKIAVQAQNFLDEVLAFLKQIKTKPLSTGSVPAKLLQRIMPLQLVKQSGHHLHPQEGLTEFLAMSRDQQMHILHRTSLLYCDHALYTDRNMRELERALSRVAQKGWVLFDDFIDTALACIGSQSEIVLKKVGKNWEYMLPTYSPAEREFIQEMVLERLAEAGTVEVGLLGGKFCFMITPFGQRLLSRD